MKVIWGEEDVALGKELATPPKDLVPNQEVVFLPKVRLECVKGEVFWGHLTGLQCLVVGRDERKNDVLFGQKALSSMQQRSIRDSRAAPNIVEAFLSYHVIPCRPLVS